ncbi:glycosyltransferase family 2 protein [Christiangramia fulva]|uniref:Glycosyltransferase family 2 protein n=1 Tax=Christiangramia fulva TaxID=2126553 RepID=A0A2R3Z0P8_9FLAO|nr:glycosyltransferase family 2 protein [Christiangramia fulva]AVR43842.1 glycosyltransferase family 2 protein [Christiangramia fulva]
MLAVVIPYYKIKFFEECLESLATQTNNNFTVYIGDDASPDDPQPLIEKFRNSLNISYKKFQENIGGKSLVSHWDRCLELTGDEKWIMILGDDDYLGPQVVERFYQELPVFEDLSNIVRFGTVTIDESSQALSGKYEHPVWETAPDSYFRRFTQQTRSSLSEYIFKRSAYEKFGFYNYPLGWFSDNKAWLDFAENKKIYSINEAIVFIRSSALNISGRTDNEKLKTEGQLQFYDHLVTDRLNLFKKEERLKLIRYYEDRLRENKRLSYIKLISLLFLYGKNYEKEEFKKFIKRSIKNLFIYKNE